MVKTLATVQISELTAISTATTDDNFIINDGNAATRRITFADLVTSVAGQAITFTQDIVFSGSTSGISIDELSDVDISTTAPTSGQVLKWDGAKFAPGDDTTSLAFELGTGEILNRAITRGHVFKLRDTYDVNKIILNTASGDIDSQGNLSGAQIQVNGAQIKLADLSDGGFLTTLSGVSAGDANLGTFNGATINDNVTIKAALQALETSLEAIDIDTDDLAALTGISENTTNLGTFTGSTISDSVAVKVALQEVETSLELKAAASAITNVDNTSDANKPVSTATQTALDLKATVATPSFTGHVYMPELRATGTGHLKLRAETGNDLNIYLNDTETLQITRDPSSGNPKFTAVGGTGECEFLQSVNLVSGFKVGGTSVTASAAELNHIVGVTSAVQTQLDTKSTSASPTFTGDVAFDTDKFFYKTSNGRTGLGTATPAGRVHALTSNGVAAVFQRETGTSQLVVKNNSADDGMTIQSNSNSINSMVFEAYGSAIGFRFYENNAGTYTQLAHIKSAGIELNKATSISEHVYSPEYRATGTGHLKLRAETGNDCILYLQDTETFQITRSGTDVRFTSNGGTGTFKFNQDVTQRPGSSVTPSANGDLSVEATNDTTLTFKLKGSDGVVRSGTITLS